MKGMSLFLIVILLFSVISICGKTKPVPAAIVPIDTLSFKMLPSDHHTIQIIYANLTKKIYFIDDIKLRKADFLNKGMCSFLNSDFIVTDVILNGKNIPFKLYQNFKAQSFNPLIRLQAFTDVKDKCSLFELVYPDLSNLPDTITVRMKYQIQISDSLKFVKFDSKKIDFDGSLFWYPRNLNQNENVRLVVRCTDQVYALLDNQYMKFKQKEYQRTFEQEFIDPMEKPVNLSFRISELK